MSRLVSKTKIYEAHHACAQPVKNERKQGADTQTADPGCRESELNILVVVHASPRAMHSCSNAALTL
jgi:hypothetical protein